MKEWIMMNIKCAFDSVRYKWYDLAFKYYSRKAKSNRKYAIKARVCLVKRDAIFDKWVNIIKEYLREITNS